VSSKRITISLDAPALARGVGFFETLLVSGRRPAFFELHRARLVRSCRELDVPPPTRPALESAVRKALARVSAGRDRAMRWSYLALGQDLDLRSSWKFFAWTFAMPADVFEKRRGIRAVLLASDWRRLTPKWKTVEYRASVAGLRAARRVGANEAFFVDSRGRILEGTVSNVFAIDGKRLLTPPESAGVLPGVVRAWVIANATRSGFAVVERPIELSALLGGGFVTASLTGLAPIESIDGSRCATPGDRFERLLTLYRASVG
jgi:branched-subunit amino acid aminotransferase/4-amino-4-deoxychorismate lyase